MQQHSVNQSFSNSSSNPSNHDIKLKKKKLATCIITKKKNVEFSSFFMHIHKHVA